MAALRFLLSQARRQCLVPKSPTYQLQSSTFLRFRRSLSSSTAQVPESESNVAESVPSRRSGPSIQIQPVSYAPKPKDESKLDNNSNLNQAQAESEELHPRELRQREARSEAGEGRQSWTREEVRYMKDAPSITPVSYTRVAPLPEYNASAEDQADNESVEMMEERKVIEADKMRVLSVRVEEKVDIPFPMLIKAKQKERPPILDLAEAIRQVKANAVRKFDESIEAHVRLGIDPKRTELAVRGNMVLPHGAPNPKSLRVGVFAQGADADDARAAGADVVGGLELIEEIAKSSKFNVDKCFSTPEMALNLRKISKILKDRGLLPKKELGTITADVAGALKELRRRVEFKMDKSSIVHVGLGKISYTDDLLRENIGAFMNALLIAKPAGLKKSSKYAGYVSSFHICSTMGPGFPVSIQSLSKAADNYKRLYLK